MDLYCPVCGEPWELDTLHEEAELRFGGHDAYLRMRDTNPNAATHNYERIFGEVSKQFRIKGCAALVNFRGTAEPCKHKDGHAHTMAVGASAAYDILGDDLDGAASMLEDWERMNR